MLYVDHLLKLDLHNESILYVHYLTTNMYHVLDGNMDYFQYSHIWECNLNSVWFLFLLNHNKYNFFFLDLQMLLKVVFGCVQGRRRMSRLYTLAHIRELPFLCV